MISKIKLPWKTLLAFALVVSATLILPVLNLKPQAGKLTQEQEKLIAVGNLIEVSFKTTGKFPGTISEIKNWASGEGLWETTDPRWLFVSPKDGTSYDWLILQEGNSFVVRSPVFERGGRGVWLQWASSTNKANIIEIQAQASQKQ